LFNSVEIVVAFLLGTFFSFIGSIPPATLNLSVLQLGLEHKRAIALRFTLAVTLIEYPYAWIGVVFEEWVRSAPGITENFQLITACVMTVLGIFNLWSVRKPSEFAVKFNQSGFRRGLLLSILNPMAIPFWVGITAYLKEQNWLTLDTQWHIHSYVLGTSVGVFLLLFLFIYLAEWVSRYIKNNWLVKLIPGVTLLILGLYAFGVYFYD
jgi:threonine/homoserine/homoserine lactone efflux protein